MDALTSAPAGRARARAEAPSATTIATRVLLGCSRCVLIESSRLCVFAAPPVGAALRLCSVQLAKRRDKYVDAERCFGESSRVDVDGVERRSEEHTSELQSLRHVVCRL